MPFKNKEKRKEYYRRNKEKINAQRREYSNRPEVRKKISQRDKIWRQKNKKKIKEYNKKFGKRYREKNRNQVFEYYGKKCICCGEENFKFLSIDHIQGEGTKHRKSIHNNLYLWLVKNNFPKDFQTLCFNCNWGRHQNGGICPHKEK